MNLIEQQKILATIISKAKRAIASAPDENLQISSSHNTTQFCVVNKNGKRSYLPKSNRQVLKILGKKYYSELVLKQAKTMKTRIDHFLKYYNFKEVLDIFENLPEELKDLIVPFEISDEQYAEQWASQTYQTKGIRNGETCYTTDNGEKVRSKSELTIANKLHSKGIKYRYEQPLYLSGYGTVYPDFTLLNPHTREEIYLEHFGLMSNPDYVESTLRKLNTYAINGIFTGNGLVITCESESNPLDTSVLDRIFDNLFK